MDLPSWRAFLVSLSGDADPSEELFYGRVEHVQTGRRATFSSPGELQAFIALVLDEKQQQTRPASLGEPDPS
ncbi:MAG TPA: hypothetical protein VLT32_16385 [Candidatus Sulfomarinibacteraceae bacterium]|nr:hypothetical protein [Candidatus Sulfomarinibacteraceae bacterium]